MSHLELEALDSLAKQRGFHELFAKACGLSERLGRGEALD